MARAPFYYELRSFILPFGAFTVWGFIMYRLYFGVLSSLIFTTLLACPVQVHDGEADTCGGTPIYSHDEYDDTCLARCPDCGGLTMSEPLADGSDHHIHMCPKKTGSCPIVGTKGCIGKDVDVTYAHINGAENLPCDAVCSKCKMKKISPSSHHPGCQYFYTPPDDGENNDGGDTGDNTGGDTGGTGAIEDVTVPSLPTVPTLTPGQLTFPENPSINSDPSFDESKLPAFNIGAFDFLKNKFGTRAPSLNIDFTVLSGGYFCQTFVIDFAKNEALLTAVSYIRAFELVCLFLAALFFMWQIIRSLEL